MIHYQKLRNRDKYIVIFSVVLLVSIFALSNSFIAHSLTQQNTINSVKGFTALSTSTLDNFIIQNYSISSTSGYTFDNLLTNYKFAIGVWASAFGYSNGVDIYPAPYLKLNNGSDYTLQYTHYLEQTTVLPYNDYATVLFNLSEKNSYVPNTYYNNTQISSNIENSNLASPPPDSQSYTFIYSNTTFLNLTQSNLVYKNGYLSGSLLKGQEFIIIAENSIPLSSNIDRIYNITIQGINSGFIAIAKSNLNVNFSVGSLLGFYIEKPQTITYSGLFSYDSIGEPFSCSLTGSYTGTPYINGVPYPYTETFKTYQLNPSKLYYTIYDGIAKTNYTEALPMYNSTAIFGINETFPFWFSIIQNGTYSNNGDSVSGSLMTFKKLDYTSTFYPYLDSVFYKNNNVLNVSHLNILTDFLFGQNLYTQIPSNNSAVIPINITIPSTNSTQYFNLSVRLQNTISLNNIILPANKSALSNININEEFGNYTSSPTYFKLVKVSNDGSISNYNNNYNEISTVTNYTFEFEIDSNGIATGTNISGIRYFTTIKNETASFQMGNSTYTINTFSVPSNPFNITFVSNLPVIPSVFGKINLTSFKALFYKSSTGYISNESPFYYTYYTKGSIPYLFNLQLNGQNYNQLGTFTYDNHNYSFGTTIDLPSTTNLTIPFYAVINGITYSNKSYLETTYFNPCLVSQPTNTQTFYGSFNNGSLSVVIKNGTNGTTGHSTSLPPPPSTPPTIIGSIGNIFKGTSTLLGFAYLNLGQFSFFFTLQFLYIVGLFIIMFFLYRKMGSHRTFTQVLLVFMGTFIIIGILTKILNGIFAVIMALLMAVELVYAFRSIL